MEPIVLERDGGIATVVLHNPEKRNVVTLAMWRGLAKSMETISADDTLRCIVLRGAGREAFAAGADISEFAAERANAMQARRYGQAIDGALRAIAGSLHPTVALIEGACLDAGLLIAAACDLRVCAETSRFGITAGRHAVNLSYTELQAVLAIAGRATTLELLLEGRTFDAPEALQKGLVNTMAPDDRVEAEAYACARRIADGAPLVARWHKRFIDRMTVKPTLSADDQDEAYAGFDTEDYRAALDASVEKAKPRFRGR